MKKVQRISSFAGIFSLNSFDNTKVKPIMVTTARSREATFVWVISSLKVQTCVFVMCFTDDL